MDIFTRRDFLKKAGLFGGGLVLSSSLLGAAKASYAPSDKLNVAMVGMGAQGTVLLSNLLKCEGIVFRAVCDIRMDNRRIAGVRMDSYNKNIGADKVKQYEDYKDLIATEKDIDVVFIATPDLWHSPQTIDFLEAGIHVYCEKMMSNTKEGARKMVKAMQSTGKLLQIGHQRKSNPNYIYLLNELILKRNVCGQLTCANGQWNRAVTQDLQAPKSARLTPELLAKYGYANEFEFMNWRWFSKYGGGPISDLGAHQIDIFAWVFGGRPKKVLASGGVDYYKNKELYDNVMCIYEYETFQKHTARAFYQVQTTTAAGGGYYELFMGDKGAVKFSENPKLIKAYAENKPELKETWVDYVSTGVVDKGHICTCKPVDVASGDARESPPLPEFDMPKSKMYKESLVHKPHIENFLNSVRGTDKLNCDAAHAFEAEAAVFKAVEAIKAGKTLEFTTEDFEA